MQYFIFGVLTAGAVIVATELFLEYGFREVRLWQQISYYLYWALPV